MIVGGGVIGASVAFHLAARGTTDVLILDESPAPASGSTGAATGGYRAQFATAINVRLSLLARTKLRAFKDEVGADPGYLPAGYLWLAENETEMHALIAGQKVQHAEGLAEAVMVSAEEASRLQPAIRREGIIGGAYCPTDGFIRPRAILEGYLSAAMQRGVRVHWGESVIGFEIGADGKIDKVVTASGTVACGAVVNAAGAWAGRVARLAHLDVPVTPLRRHLVPTVPTTIVPKAAPMTLWCGDGFHFRERDGGVLMGCPAPSDREGSFDISVDRSWTHEVEKMKDTRIPAVRDIPVDHDRAWAGLYEISPDRHALLGAAPECPNFYLVNGSSGHGVMHSPALGHLLAEIITSGTATTLDATPLSPDRFMRGQPVASPEVL
ncbi:MAG TPA: FAD-dependent oxidoreductase [Candidatus Polarisedimenticolaceae bacterium]|nr:FAD-dependent oxidoreductase [Candidatus Polarisedimenticolaceae bacterium]